MGGFKQYRQKHRDRPIEDINADFFVYEINRVNDRSNGDEMSYQDILGELKKLKRTEVEVKWLAIPSSVRSSARDYLVKCKDRRERPNAQKLVKKIAAAATTSGVVGVVGVALTAEQKKDIKDMA